MQRCGRILLKIKQRKEILQPSLFTSIPAVAPTPIPDPELENRIFALEEQLKILFDIIKDFEKKLQQKEGET
jgi:hypothetical protein